MTTGIILSPVWSMEFSFCATCSFLVFCSTNCVLSYFSWFLSLFHQIKVSVHHSLETLKAVSQGYCSLRLGSGSVLPNGQQIENHFIYLLICFSSFRFTAISSNLLTEILCLVLVTWCSVDLEVLVSNRRSTILIPLKWNLRLPHGQIELLRPLNL